MQFQWAEKNQLSMQTYSKALSFFPPFHTRACVDQKSKKSYMAIGLASNPTNGRRSDRVPLDRTTSRKFGWNVEISLNSPSLFIALSFNNFLGKLLRGLEGKGSYPCLKIDLFSAYFQTYPH